MIESPYQRFVCIVTTRPKSWSSSCWYINCHRKRSKKKVRWIIVRFHGAYSKQNRLSDKMYRLSMIVLLNLPSDPVYIFSAYCSCAAQNYLRKPQTVTQSARFFSSARFNFHRPCSWRKSICSKITSTWSTHNALNTAKRSGYKAYGVFSSLFFSFSLSIELYVYEYQEQHYTALDVCTLQKRGYNRRMSTIFALSFCAGFFFAL